MRNAELNEFFDGFLNIEVKKHQISYRETKKLDKSTAQNVKYTVYVRFIDIGK